MTDTNALRSAIVDSGLKYKALAEIMGLSPYALQVKILWAWICNSVMPSFFAEKVEFDYTQFFKRNCRSCTGGTGAAG